MVRTTSKTKDTAATVTVTEAVRQHVRSRGFSCSELSRLIGVDRAGASRYLNGKSDLRPAHFDALCRTLGLQIRLPRGRGDASRNTRGSD